MRVGDGFTLTQSRVFVTVLLGKKLLPPERTLEAAVRGWQILASGTMPRARAFCGRALGFWAGVLTVASRPADVTVLSLFGDTCALRARPHGTIPRKAETWNRCILELEGILGDLVKPQLLMHLRVKTPKSREAERLAGASRLGSHLGRDPVSAGALALLSACSLPAPGYAAALCVPVRCSVRGSGATKPTCPWERWGSSPGCHLDASLCSLA